MSSPRQHPGIAAVQKQMELSETEREDVYLKAYGVACDELAKLQEELGALDGKKMAIQIRIRKLETFIKVYQRREASG